MLNIILTDGSGTEIDAAAEAIAAFIIADETEPTPGNNDAWLADLELRNTLEKFGRETGRWGLIPRICDRADLLIVQTGGKADHVLTGRVLVLLMALNAARRLCKPDKAQINGLRIQIEKAFWPLQAKDGPRERRIRTLFYYHAAMCERFIGNYSSAANFHMLAIREAAKAGDLPGAAVSSLCQEVELSSQALVNDKAFDLALLIDRAENVVRQCRTSTNPLIRYWALANAPIHVLLAHIWRRVNLTPEVIQRWYALLEELKQVDAEAYSRTADIITVVESGLAMLRVEYTEARRFANEVIDKKGSPYQATMTAHLIQAFIALDKQQAQYHLNQIISPDHDMHQLRALARWELKRLER